MISTHRCIALFVLPVLAAAACGGAPDAPPAAPPPPAAPRPVASIAPSAAPSAAPAPAGPQVSAWITKSNEHAKVLLTALATNEPEGAARLGIDGYDDKTVDFTEGHEARSRDLLGKALEQLKARAASEADPLVKQDLAILTHSAELSIRASLVHEKHEVPFFNVGEFVFGAIRTLLDDQVAAARRPASVVRLRRYAGLEAGTRPIAELARLETAAKMGAPGLMMPARLEIEKVLQNGDVMLDGIEKLFQKYGVAGYEEPLRVFKGQMTAYQDWIKTEVLPKSRKDFRLDPEVYAVSLENFGVDRAPADLVKLGHEGFDATRAEMKKVAADVAKARHLPSADYRDVIKALRKEQIVGDAILPLYKQRLGDIEGILAREHVVTLPKRPARIRIATAAESARQPAPYLNPPRLLGNTGEQGEFVLPLHVPPPAGSKEKETKLEDFTFEAAAWSLIAHEARPGHELQFASLVERGVSIARAVFAFNSANVEGWGLYAEYITYPFMPPEGKLISLQLRLERAARVFLDPELQLGKITPAAARALLEKDVALTPALANSEVERYTFRSPGQATSYFYGYTRLLALRQELEAKLGPKFEGGKFNDWVLSQGLLPPTLMREAALRELGGT